jgi:hypothetical protein
LDREQGSNQVVVVPIAVMNSMGIMVFLRAIERDEAVYLVGIIPLLVGFALLVYGYILAPKE